MKIIIKFASVNAEAELFNTPTGRAIYDALPIQENVNRWGEEIYFGVGVHSPLEPEAKAAVAVGDLAYWPNMPAFCIFFGPTPASSGETPVAASLVNVFGRLTKPDPGELTQIPDGENITVEKVG